MPTFHSAGNVNFQKCAIIGADPIGSAIAYTLMKTDWFSQLVLLDIDPSKAQLQSMNLSNALPFHAPMTIYAGSYTDLSDAGIIVIAAGASPSHHHTDEDLAKINVPLIRTIANNIAIYNPNAILLMVSAPIDTLTYTAYLASDYPPSRVIGLGTLPDTARLKQLLGKELEVDSRQVHALIIGAHGDHELALWSYANISGIDLPDFCQQTHRDYHPDRLDLLFQELKDASRQLSHSSDAACFAIAESVKRVASAILRNENTILPVSIPVSNLYGLNDLCISLPCIINRLGISRVLELPLSHSEQLQLQRSALSVPLF